jgi:glycosyltransferase involved in cell wall biosynthesis
MQRRISLPESRFVVVPNGLDPLFDGTPGEPMTARGDSIILTVARLDAKQQYKGVDHLIEAMPAIRLAVPAARLRIIGVGTDLPRLQELAISLGAADAVDFAGFVNDDGLSAAYRECTLFALPSQGEGFGIVFLEAMAQGKPCLGARAGAIPEIIDGTSGVLADYGVIPQIAAKAVWALQRPWNPEQIRQRAAQFSYPAFRERLQRALAV